jgi:hypothetical protein
MDCEKDESATSDLLKKDLFAHEEMVEEDRPDGNEELIDHRPGYTEPFDPFVPEDVADHP